MSAEENKDMLLTLYNAIVARDFDAVGELLHEDFIEHNPGVPHEPTRQTGREAFIGGKIDAPLMMTPFASRFGMLTDRFGTPWIVTTPQAAMR